MTVLHVNHISKSFKSTITKSRYDVLKDVSLKLKEKTCLALVGESGSGKSSLAKIIVGLEKADEGEIYYEGISFKQIKRSIRKEIRQNIQIVFQDPLSSFNPRLTMRQSMSEPISNKLTLSKYERNTLIEHLIEEVGLDREILTKYPHELSGGQLQRINIARAVAAKPRVIVLDEVVSSLDAINQLKILDLLIYFKDTYHLSYLFISHDIQAVRYIADEIAVMDKGRIVEEVSNTDAINRLSHPASIRLLSSILTVPSHVKSK
ncbi:ABC transporter ATP-binding protein [Priestia megaterium]|nr:ABC transporter ATP-binding protein [Priestia megaterium]